MVHKWQTEDCNRITGSTACDRDGYGSVMIVEPNLIRNDGTARYMGLLKMSSRPYLWDLLQVFLIIRSAGMNYASPSA